MAPSSGGNSKRRSRRCYSAVTFLSSAFADPGAPSDSCQAFARETATREPKSARETNDSVFRGAIPDSRARRLSDSRDALMPGKGATTLAGYGGKHQRLRRRWAKVVRAGAAVCNRCGETIDPKEPWDLDHHDDDRRFYRGPAHSRCNRATASWRQTRFSREW